MDLDEQDKQILQEIKSKTDYFKFISREISTQQISSMLPYFDCDEPGHDGNALDQVCLDNECRHKGLCCVRCQYQRHRNHPTSVFPLHTFVASLIQQQSQKDQQLKDQAHKCAQYRDVVIQIIKDYLNGLIEHMTELVGHTHKYFQMFEQSFENLQLKSQIMVHSLIFKKHIRRDKFQRYIRDGIKGVKFVQKQQNSAYSNDYYTTVALKPQRLDERFALEQGTVMINDQENASQLTTEFQEEMQRVILQLQRLTQKLLREMTEQGQLSKFSDKIPQFKKEMYQDELSKFKVDLGVNIDSIFGTKTGMIRPFQRINHSRESVNDFKPFDGLDKQNQNNLYSTNDNQIFQPQSIVSNAAYQSLNPLPQKPEFQNEQFRKYIQF